MDFSKVRNVHQQQDTNPRRMSASPTTTTMCDTTTTSIIPPLSESSTESFAKDLPTHSQTSKFTHRLQKTSDQRGSFSPTPDTLSFYQHSQTINNHHINRLLSKDTHPYQMGMESHSFNPVRKRKLGKCQDNSKNNKGSTKRSPQLTPEKDKNISPNNGFYLNQFIVERHKQMSESDCSGKDNADHVFKLESADMKQFDEDQEMTSFINDGMRGLGSKSTVPEEVRLRINSRERQRMHDLNTALDSLRQVMPYSSGPAVKKLSKMSTLLLARNYIVMLTRSLEEMKRLVQELSANPRPKLVPATPLLPDSAYISSILAANHNPLTAATGLYLPPPPPTASSLHRIPPSLPCAISTGTPNCACVECQRKSLLAASVFLESKKSS